MTLSFHPYANLFPLIEGQEFYDLAEDIRVNGLRDRIDTLGDQILDGRNRYRALVWLITTGELLGSGWGEGSEWEALGLEGEALPAHLLRVDSWFFYPFQPDIHGDPLAYVLSKNLSRRHLTDDQRRMIAAELVTMGKGRPGKMPQSAGFSRERAAAALSTDAAGVERARTVIKRAAPEVVEAVKSGDMSVAAAAEIAAQPVERQAEIARALTRDASGKLTDEAKKALAPLVREIRADKIAAKRGRRVEREQTFGRKVQALPGDFYGVAIEDFEWHHAAWSEETGSEKSPSMHYETALDAQTPEAIVARCADRFACLAPDCILFKWVTIPHLAIGIKVLELQGFNYVTSLVWNKERAGASRGPGYWVTGEHEIVLVGVRGKVVAPATAHFRSNFSAPVGEHSEKPDNLHDMIEFHWPNVPKVEFNARRRRDGWAAWGFDAPDVTTLPVPSGETEVAAAEATDGASAAAAVEALDRAPYDAGDTIVIDQLAGSEWLAPAAAEPFDPASIDEREALKILSDFCHKRRDIAPALGEFYLARGYTHQSGDQWALRGQGWDRLRELEAAVAPPAPAVALTEPYRAAQPSLFDVARQLDDAPKAEVVDGVLQTRLPVDDDELAEQLALLAVRAGEAIDGDMARHLVGKDLAHATTKALKITERGEAFLAQLVAPATFQQQRVGAR
ncbi:MT-A70 family methyltransferase [Bradyrhizobium cosmicum]|uniref:MT-A70 family methyltransferase n=1 Tax=Bradyrhizobium cosmicum TaxID=1404864 RepID=UPI001AED58AE|nr:MT-A70 family methyltransferase [Bradyrhizobium cosmicum]